MLSSKELIELNNWYNEVNTLDKSSGLRRKIGNHSRYINLSNIKNLELHPLIYKHPHLNKINCINSSFKNHKLIIPIETSCIRLEYTKNLKTVISKCAKLERLDCQGSDISSILLPQEWTSLKKIDLRDCKIKKLQISKQMLMASLIQSPQNTLLKFNENTVIYDKEIYDFFKKNYINFPKYTEKTNISNQLF